MDKIIVVDRIRKIMAITEACIEQVGRLQPEERQAKRLSDIEYLMETILDEAGMAIDSAERD